MNQGLERAAFLRADRGQRGMSREQSGEEVVPIGKLALLDQC